MSRNSVSENLAFGFIRIASTPSKPREYGLTIIADRGIAMGRVSDLIEAAGAYIDYVKVGIGAYRLQSEEFVRRKVKAFHDANIKVFFAGDVSEAAFLQGVSQQFYKTAKNFGADAVEVSSAQVTISLRDMCELIRMAAGEGLQVVAEVGQKGHEDWTRSERYVCTQIEAYRKAGAWKVSVQSEGTSEDVEALKESLLLNLVAHFDLQDFIFQAKDGKSQYWYINTFGNQVNLDIYDHQIIDTELMRRGIRKRGVFGLVGSL
ncbi:MAG: phosphosulfolactate synthase [Betaproteobacteria bacterium]|nr:phosphosulfolactate synthase [Betaproteobacteria bacterium]